MIATWEFHIYATKSNTVFTVYSPIVSANVRLRDFHGDVSESPSMRATNCTFAPSMCHDDPSMKELKKFVSPTTEKVLNGGYESVLQRRSFEVFLGVLL